MMPKAIMRDIYKDTSFNENDFISQYKILQSKKYDAIMTA